MGLMVQGCHHNRSVTRRPMMPVYPKGAPPPLGGYEIWEKFSLFWTLRILEAGRRRLQHPRFGSPS